MGAESFQTRKKSAHRSLPIGDGVVSLVEGKQMKIILAWSVLSIMLSLTVNAAVVRIGNGDEGSDLEGASELTSGKIVDARKDAVKLMRSLNVNAVRGLGALVPEVENDKLYL